MKSTGSIAASILPIQRSTFDALVVDLLGPIVGASMARAAVEGHCRNLDIEGPEISTSRAEELVDRLRQGMTIFVGPEKATELATALRIQLASSANQDPGAS